MRNKSIHLMLGLTVAGVLLFAGSALGQSSTASPSPSPSQPTSAQPNPNPSQPAPSPAQPTSTQPGQKVGPGAYDPGHPGVNQVNNRLANQKAGIEQGLKNGTLTRQQAQQLWRNDQRIAHQEKQDMANDGGRLTTKQRQQLNRELNRNGQQIHKEKQQ